MTIICPPEKITVDQTSGIMRLDQMPLCRVVHCGDGRTLLEFKDTNGIRANYRGSPFVRIEIGAFIREVQRVVGDGENKKAPAG